MSQRSKHHILNLWYSQETRGALLPHSHPRALTGGYESMVNSLLWKGQKTASARGIVTVARDGGNVSASEEWPHANATPHRADSYVESESPAGGVLICIGSNPHDK